MCRYRVIFFKSLLGIDGHSDKCLQQSIVIRRARSAERAVEAAKRRYERRCRVADWRASRGRLRNGNRSTQQDLRESHQDKARRIDANIAKLPGLLKRDG